jgi:hypothetical protein
MNACCVLHNFIQVEKQNDPLLEAEDLQLLNLVDCELSMRPIEVNEDGITTVEATNEWTLFRDQLVLDMFAEYQRYRAQEEQRELANVP